MVSVNWNLEAEQVVLGACLTSPAVILDVATIVDIQDFYRSGHGVIFEVITSQFAAGLPTDAIAVAEVLTRSGEIARIGGAIYLHTILASVPLAASAVYYARIVADLSLRRKVEAAGRRIIQRTEQPGDDISSILAGAEQDLAEAQERHEPAGADVMNIGAFAEADLPFTDPVIPGLIHQQERLVVVASEGAGKSELGFQAAVMASAGLHPLTQDFIVPVRSVIIDLENPSANAQRRARKMLATAEGVPGWDPHRCHVWSKPGGLDLRDPSDARLLMTVIAKADPHLIVAGPVKKMTISRGETGDVLATSVTAFWDKVREKFGSALWLEHHAPLGQMGKREMRPINAALWTSWPEFGLSLYKSEDSLDPPGTLLVSSFRAPREDRVWPVKLVRSRPWSWQGIYPAGTFTR